MKRSTNRRISLAVSLTGVLLASIGNIHAAPAAAAKIPNGSITSKQLANKSVTSPKLANKSVTTSKLANISITTPKLANGSVTLSKLHPGIGVWLANGSNVFWNGNVGIGTSTPTTKLDVSGTVSAAALRAPGAGINTGTFAFVHKATAENIANHITFITNPICNGDPNAILIVTHNWSQDSSATPYHPQAVGVYYESNNRWGIFHEDNSTVMQIGDAFNVMIIKP